MFIVSFFGGLGSQMEQYAFYKALKAHYPQVIIKMDIFKLLRAGMHSEEGYELDYVFGIEKEEASLSQIQQLADIVPYGIKHRKLYTFLNDMRRKVMGVKDSWIIAEDPSVYMQEIFELNPLKSYIFHGNWSYRYWEDIWEDIWKDYTFIRPLSGNNQELADKILSTNSVSVHVRRGDYITMGLPTLEKEYYRKSIEIAESKVENPVFYFFSDDMPFVKKEFSFVKNMICVEGNSGRDAYIDMQLMSLCKHNIIANSTYSRWGAFLNRHENKIVISPKKHVREMKEPFGHPDWIMI